MSVGSDPSGARGVPARLRPRIVTTRAEPGRLDSLLAAAGADVVHVALIAAERIVVPRDLTGRLATADWVAVTSRNGAAIVAESLADEVDRSAQLAAVGRRTAQVLERAGRPVALVPGRQTAADLVEAFPDPGPDAHVVVVQAERTDGVLAAGLRRRGYSVEEIAGYRTIPRRPSARELDACRSADVITFASGSAVEAWASLGVPPPTAVAIGSSTAVRAVALGLQIDAVADDHSVDGLAAVALAVARLRP